MKREELVLIDRSKRIAMIGVLIVHIGYVIFCSLDYTRNLKAENIVFGMGVNCFYQLLITAISVIFFRDFLEESFYKLRESSLGKNIAKVATGFLIVLAINFALYTVQYVVGSLGANSTNQQNIMEYIQYFPFLMFVLDVFFGPFTEEVIYRGIIFRVFYDKGGILSLIISSVLFGAVHIFSSIGNIDSESLILSLLVYIIAGVSLGIIYLKYKNIWINVAVHSLWNFMGTGIALLKVVSGS
ncbi:MAG: CPBP family intramembrane metalloprotease [Lachnospiraceae bacterium]|nr:CPBP family intramembrane metalloprotease [Lachnospiraceae bacterium]